MRALPSPVATVALLAFVGGSVGLGDVYPFARLAMYAASPLREEGSVLEARVDGARVDLSEFVAFDGIDPAALERPDLPVSTGYVVRAVQRQLRAMPAGDRDRAAAVRVELGYRMVRVAGDAPGEGIPTNGAPADGTAADRASADRTPSAGTAPPPGPPPEALRVEPPPPALPDDPSVPPPGPPRAPGDLGRAGLRRADAAEWIPVAEGWAWRR